MASRELSYTVMDIVQTHDNMTFNETKLIDAYPGLVVLPEALTADIALKLLG